MIPADGAGTFNEIRSEGCRLQELKVESWKEGNVPVAVESTDA